MRYTKLSTNGQFTVPKAIRDAHEWAPGTEFTVEEVAGAVMFKPLKPLPRTRLEDVSGFLKYSGPAKTIDEMDEAVRRAISERQARGRY